MCCAIRNGAPLSAWRTTNMSACIATRLSIVSSSDSPFGVDDVPMFRLFTSADSRLAAISKVVRVRVELSKNRLNTDLPRSSGTFLMSRSDTPTKLAAVSRMWWISSRGSPSIVSRCRSSPFSFSCGWRIGMWASLDPQREAALLVACEGVVARRLQRPDGAAVARLDRQFAPAAIEQDGEFDARGAAVVEELVHRRADGAAGVQDVVDEHDVGRL